MIPGSSTASQRFQYDAANRLVKVKNDSGTTIAVYTYGDSNERPIAQDGDENSNYRTYYVSEGGADGARQKFTQKERDNETGLDYFGARYYASTQGRFTSVDPSLASAKVERPESWNRYAYCYNRPLVFFDPDGMDVDILDEKAKQRVLSTLPEELREKVKSQIDKNGRLKAGSLNGIKSDNANFQDLKEIVDAKGTLEVMTASKNPDGTAFFYKSDAAKTKEMHDNMISSGAS